MPTPLKLKMVSQMQLSTNFVSLSLRPHLTQSSLQRNKYSSSPVFNLCATVVAFYHVSALLAHSRPCDSVQNVRLTAKKLMGQHHVHILNIFPSYLVFRQWKPLHSPTNSYQNLMKLNLADCITAISIFSVQSDSELSPSKLLGLLRLWLDWATQTELGLRWSPSSVRVI